MQKYNLVLNIPEEFYQDTRFQKYFDYFESKANIRKTNHTTAQQFHPDLEWADAVIMWTFPEFTEEDLKIAKNLKYIGKMNSTKATVEAANAMNIPLSDMRGCYSLSVAELAVAQILNIYRNLSGHIWDMRNGSEKWVTKPPIQFPTQERELSGAKIGIIGFGGVGQNVARLLSPFSSNISISDPYVPDSVVNSFGVKKAELAHLCKTSDVIVCCAANNTGTENLINREIIQSFPVGSLFLNMGRAILLDNDALLERIQKNDMSFALDVFEVEPLPKDSPLRSQSNVYLTPHVGGTLYSFLKIFDQFVEDLEGVVEQGKPAKWPVATSQLNSLRDYK